MTMTMTMEKIGAAATELANEFYEAAEEQKTNEASKALKHLAGAFKQLIIENLMIQLYFAVPEQKDESLEKMSEFYAEKNFDDRLNENDGELKEAFYKNVENLVDHLVKNDIGSREKLKSIDEKLDKKLDDFCAKVKDIIDSSQPKTTPSIGK